MTGQPHDPAPSVKPHDQIYRELGLSLVTRLSAVVRTGRAYQVGNAVFNQQLDTFIEAVEGVLQDTEELVLVALDTDLFLNGFRIPIRPANVKFHQAVLEDFQKRKIAGIKIDRGVSRAEMERFFELFLKPDSFSGASLLEECLAGGCNRILPAVHASTHSPEAAFTSLAFGLPNDDPTADEDPAESRSPVSGNDATFDGMPDADDKLRVLRGKAPRGAARKSYYVAMAGTRSLLAPTSLHDEMQMRHAKRVVQPLVDGACDEEPVVVGLANLGHHDEYTYAHAVNVTMVAVTMGYVLGLDRRALADLGVAALLHDVGKNAVADQIEHSFEEFTEEETLAAQRHPAEGVRILARATSLNRTTVRCMRVALEHHMVEDGRGYPRIDGWQPSTLSRLVSVADAYVSLQTYRSRHGANVTPYQALGMVLGPMRRQFDPAVLWALVQTVGFYPPGQLVELDDGRIALVLAPNRDDLERPHVRVVARADRRRMSDEERVELRPLPPTMRITRSLKAEEYPEDPIAEAGERDDVPPAEGGEAA